MLLVARKTVRLAPFTKTVQLYYLLELFAEEITKNMENVTVISNVSFAFASKLWTGNIVTSAILTVFTLYIAISLIYHDVRVVNRKNQKFLQLSLEKRFAVSSKNICILIAVISVIRNANVVTLLALEKTAISSDINMQQTYYFETACKILPRIGFTCITNGTAFAYLFLWFRQKILYIHPSVNILNNKLVRATSWGIILVWFFYGFSISLWFFIVIQYEFDLDGGCLVTDNATSTFANIVITWTIVSVLMQIALLGLFIFPIIKRTSWRSKDANRNLNLLQRVKKATIITTACIISDILSTVISWAMIRRNITSFSSIYSLNLVINQLATVACFDHWQLMLWPWKHDQNKKKRHLQNFGASISGSIDQKKRDKKPTQRSENTF